MDLMEDMLQWGPDVVILGGNDIAAPGHRFGHPRIVPDGESKRCRHRCGGCHLWSLGV
ncbi:hypothetical protein DPMN_176111 [Dreissena polymorpha]|uniref:Uncharacterized protein n=1 Tax=Dreissena polymorpha TaxID=45954 RepID=A0A9D4EAC0_DREPO|nr:hypothetical protein DPMN_176111 [Dreissena polymorpha]